MRKKRRSAYLLESLEARLLFSADLAPLPVDGAKVSIPASAVIVAVSQKPDWDGLDDLPHEGSWARTRDDGSLSERLWAAGDVVNPSVAGWMPP